MWSSQDHFERSLITPTIQNTRAVGTVQRSVTYTLDSCWPNTHSVVGYSSVPLYTRTCWAQLCGLCSEWGREKQAAARFHWWQLIWVGHTEIQQTDFPLTPYVGRKSGLPQTHQVVSLSHWNSCVSADGNLMFIDVQFSVQCQRVDSSVEAFYSVYPWWSKIRFLLCDLTWYGFPLLKDHSAAFFRFKN